MSLIRKNKDRVRRKVLRVRSKLKSSVPRVSVFRSLNQIYAQVIDDVQQKTVVSCSSLELENLKGDKTAVARAVGLELAARARKQGIEKVVFDRGGALYHGRVKSLADGLREGGVTL